MAEISRWQKKHTTWRGPAIYHITIAAHDRKPLFGTLVGENAEDASVEKSTIGWILIRNIKTIRDYHPEVRILADQIMPDHLHIVLQVEKEMKRGIRGTINGYMQGCKAEARSMGIEEPLFDGRSYFKILMCKGQLDAMIQYTHDNPRRAWLKRHHPELFVMHRETDVELKDGTTLRFRSMGNHLLLSNPIRQLVQCSRSATPDMLAQQKSIVLAEAETQSVTYTAAISDGERQIARAVRDGGYPLVILLKDGFPTAGSENEKYYKPGGVYFNACAAGQLLMMEPMEETCILPMVQQAVEEALRKKAEMRHYTYTPIPVDTMRYRFMALNEIGRMLVDR